MFKRWAFIGTLLATVLLTGASCISFDTSTPQGPMGVFRSPDKGETWQQANIFPTPTGIQSLAGIQVYKMFSDPNDANAWYLATRGQGLFFSLDNTVSWQSVTALSGRFIYGLAIDPTDKCTVFATDGGSIFKTTDCNRSWGTVYGEQRGQSIVALAIDYGNHNDIFAALASGDILESMDGGASWHVTKSFGTTVRDLMADPLIPGRLYVATANKGLMRSDDGGSTWMDLSQGIQNFNDGLYFYRLVLNAGSKDNLFWLCKYGILHSEDGGKTWSETKLLSPPGSLNIYTFGINPANPKEMYYTGTVLGDNNASKTTFYKSVDGGINWTTKKMPTNTIPVSLIVNPTNPSTLFMTFTAAPDIK